MGFKVTNKMDRAAASLDWSFKGMNTLALENKFLKVSVLLDKGSDIFELIYKPKDIDLMWHTPIGYRNPKSYIQNSANPSDTFHDYYGGGWNDIFPNYGNPSANRGAKFVGHGESALLPWTCDAIDDGNGAATAKLSVNCVRYPIAAKKKITLDVSMPLLTISEDIANLGEQEVEISWAQHIAYGEPFIGEDLEIEIPAIRAMTSSFKVSYTRLVHRKQFAWPRAPGVDGKKVDLSKIPPREAQVQEDFPITELKARRYRLYNKKLDLGVEVSWNSAFPNLWYWLSWGVPDYPYFGRGRTLALEPTTSSTGNGLADDIKAGSAKVLRPKEKLHGEIRFNVSSRETGDS
jgi:hypothetical protein